MRTGAGPAALLCLAAAALGGCVMNRVGGEPRTITLDRPAGGQPLTIEVEAGEAWSGRMQAGPFIFNVLPQIAVWAEDGQGRLVDTLYVTGAGGKGTRHAGKKEKGAAFYRECFPVWASRLEAAGGSLPGPENPYPDSVTSATPSAGFTLLAALPGAARPHALYLEVNQSGDTNALYTRENNDWAGQPSVIYRAVIEGMAPGTAVDMEPVGHGGRIGEAPALHPDLSGLDTALRQLEWVRISLK